MGKYKFNKRIMRRKSKYFNPHKSQLSVFLYGRLRQIGKAKGYCKLHKCYLEPKDIKEKCCNYKNCKNLIEV